MVKYRRFMIKGGMYFFTVVLHDRSAHYLTQYIAELRGAIAHVRNIHPFKTKAMVVMPDHLHVIWALPEGDANFSLRWECIKKEFARKLKKSGVFIASRIWQRRFWEHVIRDEYDYEKHIDYIHYNPVKHQLVTNVKDWPYSTFHHYVKKGFYSIDWGTPPTIELNE